MRRRVITPLAGDTRDKEISRILGEIHNPRDRFPEIGINFFPGEEEGLDHLYGTICGPVGTPYEGGIFHVDIKLSGYPFFPPELRFLTKVWHPNISHKDGSICFESVVWNPVIKLKAILLSLQALLLCPQPDDPFDTVVAEQYRASHTEFEATARNWTKTFAQNASPPFHPDGIKKKVLSFISKWAGRPLQRKVAVGTELRVARRLPILVIKIIVLALLLHVACFICGI